MTMTFFCRKKNLAKFVIKYLKLGDLYCGKIIIYFMIPQNFTVIVETVEKYKVSGKMKVFFLSRLVNKGKSTFFLYSKFSFSLCLSKLYVYLLVLKTIDNSK